MHTNTNDIDVHIIRPQVTTTITQEWFDKCLDSLKDEPVNIHFADYVAGDIRAARRAGFLMGNAKYVSFVDYDDWVEPGIFSHVYERLERRPDACGAFTLSNRVIEFVNVGLLNPFKPWPLPARGNLVDIHQLVVMRRDRCVPIYLEQYDDIPPNVHEMTWVYWEMARRWPWVAIDRVGYNWRQRLDGAHRIDNPEVAESLRKSLQHMQEIRRNLRR